MRHATSGSLDGLEELLQQIRGLRMLKEKSRGVFYLRGSAALHFHEDPAGIFADLRLGGEWERLAVNTEAERVALVRRIARVRSPRGAA